MPRSHPAVFRATHPPVRHPDRSRRDGQALCAQRRRSGCSSGPSGARSIGLGFAVQLCLLRYPGQGAGPGEHPPEAMIVFVAQQLGVSIQPLFADYALRDQTRREHAVELQKLSAPAELRAGRLAGLPAGGHGRGVGHGSRRADRPGDARPSADDQRLLPAAAVLERIGLAARARARKKTFEALADGLTDAERDALDRLADGRSGIAPLPLRLAAGLFGVAGALQHRRAARSPRIRARAGNRPERAPDEFMPPASPGWSTKARS